MNQPDIVPKNDNDLHNLNFIQLMKRIEHAVKNEQFELAALLQKEIDRRSIHN